MQRFIDSNYAKHARPYFDSKARYGREPDTIVFFYLLTPTGRFSKYNATLSFNSERNCTQSYKLAKVEDFKKQLVEHTFRMEIRKGYTLAEPLLYSGEI